MMCSELVDVVVSGLRSFYGQDIYKEIGPSLSEKSMANKVILSLVGVFSGFTVLNFLLLSSVVLFYRAFRFPDESKGAFQYGVTKNNLMAFEKLNACLRDEVRGDISINSRPAALKDRLRTICSFCSLWSAAKVIKKKRHSGAYVHLQMIVGAAACLLYEKSRLCDQVSLLCVANDHAPVPRALLTLFRMQGVSTCYVQHAPVAKYFPPLAVDLAVLYDQASLEAYEVAAKEADIERDAQIVFMPPFDDGFLSPACGSSSGSVVGVCLSKLPDLDALSELLSSLCSCSRVESIVLRPHPASKVDLSPLIREPKVSLQKSGASLGEFSSQLSLALVPTSGVAIELMHKGLPTFYTPGMDDVPYDYYGFVSDGILPVFNVDQFYEMGTDLSFFDKAWKERFSRYDVTVNTSIEECFDRVGKAFSDLINKGI